MATARPVTEGSVVISPRGVERLRSGHLWVYRSDVRSAHAEPGAVVRLTDERGNFLGRAFYSDKSQISIRLLTREDVAHRPRISCGANSPGCGLSRIGGRKLRRLPAGLQRSRSAAFGDR